MSKVTPVCSNNPYDPNFEKESTSPVKKVLDYMRSFPVSYRAGYVFDPVIDSYTDIELCAFTDGTWGWDSSDTYLYEKYSLRLSEGFIKHVLTSN